MLIISHSGERERATTLGGEREITDLKKFPAFSPQANYSIRERLVMSVVDI